MAYGLKACSCHPLNTSKKRAGLMVSVDKQAVQKLNFFHTFVAHLQEAHSPKGIMQELFQCEITAIFT